MAEFEDKQASLNGARKRVNESRRELFAAREKQRRVLRLRDALKRQAGVGAIDARIQELTRQSEELAESIQAFKARAKEQARLERADLEAFSLFSNPIDNISRLDDRYPILLFPVRIETRFKEIPGDSDGVNQLWVRVYPDDIAVDTFEEMLSEVEVKNARIYWTNIWKAGGVEGEKRAAWRSMVKSHGAGRAFRIVEHEQVKPTNINEEPAKDEGDWILVIVSDDPLPPAEKPAVRAYWRAIWLAENNQAQIEAAAADLLAAVGQERADVINTDYVPQNLSKRPADESSVTNVRVEYLELPRAGQVETQQQPWMHSANTAILPERFVLLGFNVGKETLRIVGNSIPSELVIGPNPAADPDEQIRSEGDELVVPNEMKWMVDFEEAVEKGMGFKVNLSATQARLGFDRLFVLGLRLSADIEKSKEQLETLIAHHQESRKGFSILPQGAPTNNVEDDESGYTWRADSDLSYDHYFKQDPTDDPPDWRLRKDGRWLAESLGIDADLLKASTNYYATDQCEARAMNIALWPATLGNFMEQLMAPVFADRTIDSARAFFNRYVLGRGTIPAVRVGNQPYGILPTTAFSRIGWIRREILADDRFDTHIPDQFLFLQRLHALIVKADETWTKLKDEQVSYVGKPGSDPQQTLLDVVGLHPSSVEFYQRYAETLEQLYNRLKYSTAWGDFAAAITSLTYIMSGTQLLRTLGYDAQKSGIPEILNKFFLRTANLLKGPVIDDRPLSEMETIRPYREDGTNYLEWLIEAARDSHDTLRAQKGFIEERPPTALLYLILHHALDVSYLDTSLQLHLSADVLTQDQVFAARKPPNFIHVQDPQEDTGSQWQYLYKTEPAITNSQTLTIAEFIPSILTSLNPYLNTQLEALEHLKHIPTARLERAFAEHIDCCTNRLDAWWLGLVNVQLGLMRSSAALGDAQTATGSYLGAFGWLEDVRSEHKRLEPVNLDGELDKIFNKEGDPPVVQDHENFGYIHAPSLNHAVTAAVLRNGYLSNATPQNPESLAINLTSERVRVAMGVIEGIRNGQSLAALLGYQFERGLHDQKNLFLDSLIFEFRKQFPLAGNRLSSTRTEDDEVGIEAV
ncbi:MAG: hypothetical protein OES09_12500, partial [Gammaproteobacteria bacterium]|nr:hypothetical protein [Gammaproteobacteria bacterium]